MDESKFNKSLKNLLYALDVSEKQNLTKIQCGVLNSLTNLSLIQKDTLKALAYLKKNKAIALKEDYKDYLLGNYNTMALILANKKNEEALTYYQKALAIAKELNDSYSQFLLNINLSDFYLSIPKKPNFRKALECLQEAEVKAKELKNPQNLFFVYYNYGGYYKKTKKFNEAEKYYLKAKVLSNSGVDDEQVLNLKNTLVNFYKDKGDFKNAFLYKEKVQEQNDSIFTVEKNKAFNEIQTKYEVEKKNLKIKLLSKEKEIEKERKKLITTIGVVLVILLSFILLFFRNKAKVQKIINENENKIHLQEITKLEQEKEFKKVLGIIEGQDNERNRIAKEIHDGVAGDLASIKLHLFQANKLINNETVATVIKQISKTFTELRNISHNLSSNYIKNRDFTLVLIELKKEYEERNEFKINLVIFPENTFQFYSENTKHQIHRILQELLSNISKHANAKNVSISITNHNDYLNIIVQDDGKGFLEKHEKGIGLKNIEERITSIDGTITIESTIGNGSSITIDIPNEL
jgi:signal transduction histidine kinase